MIEPPMDQSILRDKTVTLVFEGQAEQFYDVMLGYMISNNNISYPYKWTPSPNKKAFILEIVGGSPNHRPVTLFPSPLPRFRSQLHFQIPEYNFEEYQKICNLLVEYLKNMGWIQADIPQENSHIDSSKSNKHKKSDCPKKPETLALYQKIFVVIEEMEKDYAIKFAAGQTTASKPLESDIAQSLEVKIKKTISERTIRRVKRCAIERGWRSS